MSILMEKNGAVVTLTLNRPQALNSLDGQLVDEFAACLEDMAEKREVRALILTGSGKAFCAGGDLAYMREKSADPPSLQNFIGQVGDLVRRLHHFYCPTVAMVNGVAAGAGANLALACDLIYCASSARFGQSFAKVGLIPDAGGHYFLPRAVGLAKAKELMFTGRLVGASEALEIGLVNQVVDDEHLKQAVMDLVAELAAGPPLALAAVKRNLNLSLESTLDQVLALETAGQSLALLSEDGREGMAAFAEKRAPVFKGR